MRLEIVDDGSDGEIDAALQVHGVHAGGDRFGALADDRLGEHGRRRSPVAGEIIGLGRDLSDQLRAHVLELVLELDLLGDRDTVLGDPRRAEALVDHDVAALWSEGHLDRVCERVHAPQHAITRVG